MKNGFLKEFWPTYFFGISGQWNAGHWEFGLKLGESWVWVLWAGYFEFCIERWREDADRWRYQDILFDVMRFNGCTKFTFNQRGIK